MRPTAGPPARGGFSSSNPTMSTSSPPVTIKQYGGQRLYHSAAGRYMTLDDLAAIVEDGEDFVVHEAKTGEDITSTILKQIIRQRAIHG
jgi:polyhydroxyalkanoate synthesis repressor PhaR